MRARLQPRLILGERDGSARDTINELYLLANRAWQRFIFESSQDLVGGGIMVRFFRRLWH